MAAHRRRAPHRRDAADHAQGGPAVDRQHHRPGPAQGRQRGLLRAGLALHAEAHQRVTCDGHRARPGVHQPGVDPAQRRGRGPHHRQDRRADPPPRRQVPQAEASMITENRFLEVDHQMRHRRRHHGVPRYAGIESLALPFAATDRVLVVLIENGGINLGIPWLVDKLLSMVPGASMLPGSVRDGMVNALRRKLEEITDNLLESAELTLNRYSSAKPDPYGDVVILRDATATYADLKRTLIAQAGANKIIDLVILTHGGPDSISVVDGIDGDKLRAMKAEAGRPLTIRAV